MSLLWLGCFLGGFQHLGRFYLNLFFNLIPTCVLVIFELKKFNKHYLLNITSFILVITPFFAKQFREEERSSCRRRRTATLLPTRFSFVFLTFMFIMCFLILSIIFDFNLYDLFLFGDCNMVE